MTIIISILIMVAFALVLHAVLEFFEFHEHECVSCSHNEHKHAKEEHLGAIRVRCQVVYPDYTRCACLNLKTKSVKDHLKEATKWIRG